MNRNTVFTPFFDSQHVIFTMPIDKTVFCVFLPGRYYYNQDLICNRNQLWNVQKMGQIKPSNKDICQLCLLVEKSPQPAQTCLVFGLLVFLLHDNNVARVLPKVVWTKFDTHLTRYVTIFLNSLYLKKSQCFHFISCIKTRHCFVRKRLINF